MPDVQGTMFCGFCGHASHERGQKCGVVQADGKHCKCKAGAHWYDSIGNAIGEAMFGGNR